MLIHAINAFFNLIRHLEAKHITKTTFEEPKETADESSKAKTAPRPQIPRIDPDADLDDVMHLLFRRVVIPLYGRKLSKAMPLLIASTEYFLSQRDLFEIDQDTQETGKTSGGHKGEACSSQNAPRPLYHHANTPFTAQEQTSSSTKDSAERLAHILTHNRENGTEVRSISPQNKIAQDPKGSRAKKARHEPVKRTTDAVVADVPPLFAAAPVAASSVFSRDNFAMEDRVSAQSDPSERHSARQNRSTLLTVARLQPTGGHSGSLKSDTPTRSEPKLPTVQQRCVDERISVSAPPSTSHSSELPASAGVDRPFYECPFFSYRTPIWDIIYYCWGLLDAVCFLHNLTKEFAEAFSNLFEGCRNDYCTYMIDQIRRTPELSHAYRRNLNMVSTINTTNGSDIKFYHLFFIKRDPMYFTRNYKCSLILQHAILIGGSSNDFLAALFYISGRLSACVKTICDGADPTVQEFCAKLTTSCAASDTLPPGLKPSRYSTKEVAYIDARTYLSWLGLLGTTYTSVISLTTYRTLLNPYIKSTTPTHCCLSRLLTRILQAKRRCILPPSLRFNKPYNPVNVKTTEQHDAEFEPSLKKVRSDVPSMDKPAERILSPLRADCASSRSKPTNAQESNTSNSDEIPWSTLFDDRDGHDTTLARAESYSSISFLSALHEADTPVPIQGLPDPVAIPRYNIQLPPAPCHRNRFVPRSLVGFHLVERVNGRCSRRDSNPRPFVRETNVITNYTTRARRAQSRQHSFFCSIFSVFTCCRSPGAGAAPRTPSARPARRTHTRCGLICPAARPVQHAARGSCLGRAP